MIRQCKICNTDFEPCSPQSRVSTCIQHRGMQTSNSRVRNGVLQRKCAKCLRWESKESFPNKVSKEWSGKSSWCKRCFSKGCYGYQQQRGLKRRAQILKEAGNRCMSCGYNKNSAALTFHHRDNQTKRFALDTRSCSNRSMEKLKIEVAKCDILCHNCHMELHYPSHAMGH